VKNTIARWDLSCILCRTPRRKLISYHLSHNNYRSNELRHSFHPIDSMTLTQASVNQLPGSPAVNNWAVSVGSSVSDIWTAGTFRRSQGLQSSSINPRMKRAKICCRKRMRWSSYSEQCILKHLYYLSTKDRSFFGLFWSTFCLFYLRWRFATKVVKTPHQVVAPWYFNTFFEAVTKIFLVKKSVFNGVRDTVVQFTDCVVQPWVWDYESIGKHAHPRM